MNKQAPDKNPAQQSGFDATVAISSVTGEPRSAPSETSPLRERALIAGRYEILGLVGVGGMGSVYRAHDAELDEEIALKLLRPEIADAPGVLDRFRREVKLARRVTHKNVARTFDIGEDAGNKFLTMELIRGESLGARLVRERMIPLRETLSIATDICAGLAAAHEAGVVHRDLKPDNVLIAKDGRVLLTDFGIARAYETAQDPDKTMGLTVGTPAYMAPEQVEASTEIDARADIYAFGAMLFELLTGEHAWPGDLPLAVATARLVKPPPDPRMRRHGITDAQAAIVMRCMQRARGDRFASAGEVAAAIASLTSGPMPTLGSLPPLSASMLSTADFEGSAMDRALAQIAPGPATKTVAVLPFQNRGESDDEYIADGLTDDLIDTLSMTPGLRVRARAAKGRGEGDDARALGRELDVQVVVDGTVRKAKDNVHVRVRVIGVADGFQLWAKRFEGPAGDLFAVNDEVARAVCEALTTGGDAPARSAPTDPVAIDLYLRGRHEYRGFWMDHNVRAVSLFEEALARAPSDPTILAAYAMARARLIFFGGEGRELSSKLALDAAERAVQVAPHLGEARLALATVKLHLGDAVSAVHEAKLAVQRSPSLAEAHGMLGRILVEAGRAEEGVRSLTAALSLDPQTPLAMQDLARTKALLGQWDEVDAMIERANETEHDAVRWLIRARMASWRGDLARANECVASIKQVPGELGFANMMKELLTNGELLGGGQRFRSLASTREGGSRRQMFFYQIEAELAALVGNEDWAIDALRLSVDAGLIDALWIERCPLMQRLHHRPEMGPLRAEMAVRARRILIAFLAG